VRFKTPSKMKEKAMIKTAKMQGNVMVSAVGREPTLRNVWGGVGVGGVRLQKY
jgi:hypothetical protein